MKSFNTYLEEQIKTKKSHLCVGLDLAIESFGRINPDLEYLKTHTKKIIDTTRDLAVAYKPNLGFFERWGSKGFEWLEETMDYIGDESVTIGDAKRGDIGNTVKQYAFSLFDHFKFNAVTVNPFMGSDSIQPFIDRPEKGVFILCRTSNNSAKELQNQKIGNEYLYEKVAKLGVRLNSNNNVGLVVGATAPEELQKIRSIANGLPFLIPGVGAQGGDLKKSMEFGNTSGIALINISRGICFAGDMSGNAIRKAAENYLSQIREFSNEF